MAQRHDEQKSINMTSKRENQHHCASPLALSAQKAVHRILDAAMKLLMPCPKASWRSMISGVANMGSVVWVTGSCTWRHGTAGGDCGDGDALPPLSLLLALSLLRVSSKSDTSNSVVSTGRTSCDNRIPASHNPFRTLPNRAVYSWDAHERWNCQKRDRFRSWERGGLWWLEPHWLTGGIAGGRRLWGL